MRKRFQWQSGVKKEYSNRISTETWNAHEVEIKRYYTQNTLEETKVWVESELGLSISYVLL
jgi:hypothetical protein